MRNLTLKNLMFWPGHMESMSSYPLKQTSCMTEQPLKKGENCTILKMGFTITCNGTSTGNGTAGDEGVWRRGAAMECCHGRATMAPAEHVNMWGRVELLILLLKQTNKFYFVLKFHV